MKKWIALLIVVLASACLFAQNASPLTTFSYTQIPDGPSPCVNGNRANGVNQRGDIVGRCKDAGGNPRSWALPKGTTTPALIDFSTAPFIPALGSTTRAINGRGDIVGRYFDAAGVSHGYLLSGGAFTAIDVPFAGSVDTDTRGVNNSGTIVGFYDVLTPLPGLGTIPVAHGFMSNGGTFTPVDFPGAVSTALLGINDAGDVVGWYVAITDATTTPPGIAIHGFLLSKGVYTTIDVPGATGTQAWGINEQGEIAGSFATGTITVFDLLKEDPPVPTHGFIRSADGAIFTQIDFPGAISTGCRGGVNDHGNIVGAFSDVSLTQHAFVTSR